MIEKIILKFVNVYLIKIREGYMLIDAGLKGSYQSFKNILKKKNIQISSIKYILVTHHHSDHTGFLSVLREEYPQIVLIAHKKEVSALKEGKTLPFKSKNLLLKFFSGFNSGKFEPVEIKNSDIILDGDSEILFQKEGLNAKILHTPGHTPGSISIVLDDGRAVIGDLLMNFSPDIFLSNPFPLVFSDLEQVKKSCKKLLDEGVSIFLPGHGEEISAEIVRKII